MKNMILGCLILVFCVSTTGCRQISNTAENNSIQNPKPQITDGNNVSSGESSLTDTMLDKFILGEIEATDPTLQRNFFITELDIESEEWDSYRIGERIDLDNDGEKELVLEGPYGGMYIDVQSSQIVVFAEGEGTAAELSYVYYDAAYWIVKSDITHDGRQRRLFTKYSGADTIIDSFELNAEYWEQNGYDENSEFTYCGEKITMEQYEELYSKIFNY